MGSIICFFTVALTYTDWIDLMLYPHSTFYLTIPGLRNIWQQHLILSWQPLTVQEVKEAQEVKGALEVETVGLRLKLLYEYLKPKDKTSRVYIFLKKTHPSLYQHLLKFYNCLIYSLQFPKINWFIHFRKNIYRQKVTQNQANEKLINHVPLTFYFLFVPCQC